MSNYRVKMTDITKSFGGVHALQEVSFNVRPGQIHALVGVIDDPQGIGGTVHGVRDLPGLRVGVVVESSIIGPLGDRGIAALPFANERDGLRAMVDGRLDAFVFNILVLRHLAKTEFLGRSCSR